MYAVILVIWTATTGGAAYVMYEAASYQSVEHCQEAARKQKVEKFKCIAKKG